MKVTLLFKQWLHKKGSDIYKCDEKQGGCESLIPMYYTFCPVCRKKLGNKVIHFKKQRNELKKEKETVHLVVEAELKLDELD